MGSDMRSLFTHKGNKSMWEVTWLKPNGCYKTRRYKDYGYEHAEHWARYHSVFNRWAIISIEQLFYRKELVNRYGFKTSGWFSKAQLNRLNG